MTSIIIRVFVFVEKLVVKSGAITLTWFIINRSALEFQFNFITGVRFLRVIVIRIRGSFLLFLRINLILRTSIPAHSVISAANPHHLRNPVVAIQTINQMVNNSVQSGAQASTGYDCSGSVFPTEMRVFTRPRSV